MHERNVAHRDIKPSNFVFFKKDRTWKLIDYGTAKIEQDLKQVKEYSICGTRLYAIPKISEMKNFGELLCKVSMSLKAYDIYSLGITFIKIKKLLVNPFDQKALKQIIQQGALSDESFLSNKIINALIAQREEDRINLNLNDLIEDIENCSGQKVTIPNDYGVMYDNHSDFNYSKQSMEDEDQFERALTLKKINQLDSSLSILFILIEKDTQLKLKANALFQIGQIYIIKGNYLQSLKYLEKAKEQILEVYPKDSVKHGEVFEELGQVSFYLNKRDEGLEYLKRSFKIYQKNPLDCQYKINKLKNRLQGHGLHINILNEQLSQHRMRKKQFTMQYEQNQPFEKIQLMKQRSIQQHF